MGAMKMALQDYKRQVESFLKSLKTPEQRIKNLMKECVSDIQGAYKKKLGREIDSNPNVHEPSLKSPTQKMCPQKK